MYKKCEIIFQFLDLRKAKNMYFGLMWMKDNNSQNAPASLP